MKVIGITIAVITVGLIIFLSVFFTLRRNRNDSSPTLPPRPNPSPSPILDASFVPSLPGERCGKIDNDCSFKDTFNNFNSTRWLKTHNRANQLPFGVWWNENNVIVNDGLTFELKKENNIEFEKSYSSGQLQSKLWFQYGCFYSKIKGTNKPGLITSFFLYTGRFDSVPNSNYSKLHNEIDFEFLWRPKPNKSIIQTNYYTQGNKQNQTFKFQKFDMAKNFNDYSIKWNSTYLAWSVNGIIIRSLSNLNTPTIENGGPMKIFLNFWSVSEKSNDTQLWAGKYVHTENAQVFYDSINYTRGEDCSVTY